MRFFHVYISFLYIITKTPHFCNSVFYIRRGFILLKILQFAAIINPYYLISYHHAFLAYKEGSIMNYTELIVFIVYFLFMLGIGLFFFFRSKDSGEKDYLAAAKWERGFLPFLQALPT